MKKKEKIIIDLCKTNKKEQLANLAKEVQKIDNYRKIRMDFMKTQIDNVRTEFKKQFGGTTSVVDYYIFNSIKWDF